MKEIEVGDIVCRKEPIPESVKCVINEGTVTSIRCLPDGEKEYTINAIGTAWRTFCVLKENEIILRYKGKDLVERAIQTLKNKGYEIEQSSEDRTLFSKRHSREVYGLTVDVITCIVIGKTDSPVVICHKLAVEEGEGEESEVDRTYSKVDIRKLSNGIIIKILEEEALAAYKEMLYRKHK